MVRVCELTLNLSKSEHLFIRDTTNPVTYALTSRTPPYAQPIEKISTIRDLGLLNIGFTDNGVKPIAANTRSALEQSRTGTHCQRRL